MVPDWPSIKDFQKDWVRLGPARFEQTFPGPILYCCGLLKVVFAPADKGTRAIAGIMPDFEGVLKRSKLVGDRVIPLHLPGGDRVTLGSDPGCTVFVPDMAVSQTHCAIEQSAGAVHIIDGFSKNGTWVNEERLAAGESRLLANLDLICVGRYAFRYFESATALIRHPDPTAGLPLVEGRRG